MQESLGHRVVLLLYLSCGECHFAATIDHVIMVIHSQKLHNHLVSNKGHSTTYCPSKDAITPNCHPFPLILQVVSSP